MACGVENESRSAEKNTNEEQEVNISDFDVNLQENEVCVIYCLSVIY